MADQCAGQWYLHSCDLGQSDDDRVGINKFLTALFSFFLQVRYKDLTINHCCFM